MSILLSISTSNPLIIGNVPVAKNDTQDVQILIEGVKAGLARSKPRGDREFAYGSTPFSSISGFSEAQGEDGNALSIADVCRNPTEVVGKSQLRHVPARRFSVFGIPNEKELPRDIYSQYIGTESSRETGKNFVVTPKERCQLIQQPRLLVMVE